jgi:hypothetical protein
MLGHMCEVFVSGQQHHIVPNAKLRQQRINGTDLDSRAAAGVAQGGGVNVIIPIGLEQRQCGKSLDDLGLRLGTKKTLQKLLQNQSGSDDDF